MDESGLFRRSLRRINPFRNKLFRLPATPRLSRSRKVGNGEDVVTDWNFERSSFRRSNRPPDTASLGQDSLDYDTLESVSLALPPQKKNAPPDPKEAEMNIHEHMQSLLVLNRRSDLLHLPQTRYGADGEVCTAFWSRDYEQSPNQSTISLLRTNTRFPRDRNGSLMSRTPSLQHRYPLNGIARPRSTEPTQRESFVLPMLFDLNAFYGTQQLEEAFLGREWLFREIYQSAIIEKIAITVIEGCKGAGKSTIANQLILNSPFYSGKTSDTLDSGCVSDCATLHSSNYEWLRALSARVVAYHVCSLHNASSCSLPEFVCNLGAALSRSPVLKSYADILEKNAELLNMLRLDECEKTNALAVFAKAIAQPLGQLKSSDQGCLVVVIDGLDEAEFHRSEDGTSLATLLSTLVHQLPPWLRFIVTCDEETSSRISDKSVRRVRIDETILDERVVRDNRMLVEYRISMVRDLEDGLISLRRQSTLDPLASFCELVVNAALGSMGYIRILLSLLETGKLRLNSLSKQHLPANTDELYTLFMEHTFTSQAAYERVCPVLNVLLAALRPLERTVLGNVLNASNKHRRTTEAELNEILTIIAPLLCFTNNGGICLHHISFRDWLLRNKGKFQADARNGHILHALFLTQQAPLNNDDLFELAHHLLKAHPYKYMNGEYLPELTSSKEGHIKWIAKCSQNIARVLLHPRNIYAPNTKVTRVLLMAGADPNVIDFDGESLAQKVCAVGNWPLFSLLLHHGASLNPPNGRSLLCTAARHGHNEFVHSLFHIDQQKSPKDALVAAASGGHQQIVSFLIGSNSGSQEERINAIQETLEAAAAEGHIRVCQYLADSFSALDLTKAMAVACKQGKADTVQFLLSRGASLSSVSWPDDRSALHCAVESGSWDLVVAVLAMPHVALDAVDEQGKTPLICAARCGHVGLVDMLINKGANVNHRDTRGWSALMHAVQKGHLSTVQLLLDRDADMSACDQSGCHVAHIASAYANRAVMDRLLERGLLIEERDSRGERPVETAIRMRNRSALEALLRRGARLRSTTWIAAQQNDPEALFVLLSKLLEDAGILFRRKRYEDALHRLHYALNKCEAYIGDSSVLAYRPRLIRVKLQVLLSTSRVHRKEGDLERAIQVCDEVASLCETDDVLFEALLLRAKCHFDRHDVDRARADARAATQLRPQEEEARHLLQTLQLPVTNISRL